MCVCVCVRVEQSSRFWVAVAPFSLLPPRRIDLWDIFALFYLWAAPLRSFISEAECAGKKKKENLHMASVKALHPWDGRVLGGATRGKMEMER